MTLLSVDLCTVVPNKAVLRNQETKEEKTVNSYDSLKATDLTKWWVDPFEVTFKDEKVEKVSAGSVALLVKELWNRKVDGKFMQLRGDSKLIERVKNKEGMDNDLVPLEVTDFPMMAIGKTYIMVSLNNAINYPGLPGPMKL